MGLERGDLGAEEVEPVDRKESEQSTLLRNSLDCCQCDCKSWSVISVLIYILHDHIVCRDAISGYKEKCLGVNLVDFADLAACNLLQSVLLDCSWLARVPKRFARIRTERVLLTLRIDLRYCS